MHVVVVALHFDFDESEFPALITLTDPDIESIPTTSMPQMSLKINSHTNTQLLLSANNNPSIYPQYIQ